MFLAALHRGSVEFAFSAARANASSFVSVFVGFGKCDPTIDYALLRHGVKDVITLVSKSVMPECVRIRMWYIG